MLKWHGKPGNRRAFPPITRLFERSLSIWRFGDSQETIFPAYSMALDMLAGFPTPLPAMSNAVP